LYYESGLYIRVVSVNVDVRPLFRLRSYSITHTMHRRCCRLVPAGNIVGALYHKLQTQSSAPEYGRNYRPNHVELTEIINKQLLLHLVGCLFYRISDARSH